MNERLRELREYFKVTQAEFSKMLGIGQSTLAMMEVSKRPISERHIKSVCAILNVNEEWLRTGQGEMLKQDTSSVVDQLAHEYSLDAVDRAIVESFLQLNRSQRAVIKQYIENVAHAACLAAAPDTSDAALAAIATMQDYASMVADEKHGKGNSSTSAG